MNYDALPPGLLPIFLRLPAASAFFGVSESTFLRMVAESHAPRPVKFGKLALWFRPALVAAAAKMSGVEISAGSVQTEMQEAPSEWDAVLKR
ncbi:AlpA family transcriptional regulator [Acetobacter pasteurianus]|uniref:Uncharacterized protein n=1 Tax=Acetobacter pasteurianus subsp. pasteurianus TaxID=481145 RepID=A0AAC9SS05_ACEPA|nr:hypothetical protein [Acetobacter pasteurianus]ASC06303.1 hypothetical protein S101468_02076 [Acetobacter pasteurianus subsp. pasteurianus]